MGDHKHEENEVEPWKRAPIHASLVILPFMRHFNLTNLYLKPVMRPHDMEKNMSAT